MQGYINDWKKYIEHHEDAVLFITLLEKERSNKNKIRLFLKLRKLILGRLNQKILQ